MALARPSSRIWVLVGSMCLCAALGSVHGFSVFLEPLEARLSVGRATVSLTYSIALIALTAAVLVGPKIYGRIAPAVIVALAGGAAIVGVLIAGAWPNLPALWIGYSLCFGAANGLGYGFTLQLAGQAAPQREGLAMGLVTAAYALGAAASPPIFEAALARAGFAAAMSDLAIGLAGATVIGVVCIWVSRIDFKTALDMRQSARHVGPVWLAYGSAVLAGLMAIGHAAGIATALAPDIPGWSAPAILAICNLMGSLVAGRLSDTWPARRLLTALPLVSACALALLLVPGSGMVILGLAGIGLAYGGTIAAYPAIIAKQFGPEAGAQFYGKVFTAWGAAGLRGPWIAGLLFDVTAGYHLALILAGLIAISSAALARRAFRNSDN